MKTKTNITPILCVVAVVSLTMVSVAAQGDPITVANAGFEDPKPADGAHSRGERAIDLVPGWEQTELPDALVFNPSTEYFSAETPEGSNALFLDNRYDAWQQTAKVTQTGLAVIDESKQYELKVKVGQTKGSTIFGDYTIYLLKDDAVAAAISNYGDGKGATPSPDKWVEVTLTYKPVAGDAGKKLGIRLETGIKGTVAASSCTWFDDVRLSDSPISKAK